MKILYGVVGEGMGHAMRSAVVLEHLIGAGHEVEIVSSARAVDYLAARFAKVRAIHGLHIVTRDNRVERLETALSNLVTGVAALPQQIAAYFRLIREFRPELVISDFESWTYIYARMHGLPVISVDNQQFIHRCHQEPELYAGHETAFRFTKAFVKAKLPGCSHYIVTSFVNAELRKPNTTVVPPIIRSDVLQAKVREGQHILVYQSVRGAEALKRSLSQLGCEVRCYGLEPGLQADRREGALLHRPFSATTFVEDLASCVGVIAGAGYTLMSECVALGKPMLAIPLERQFEQLFNARLLEHAGFGWCAEDISHGVLERFMAEREGAAQRLAGYQQRDNAQALEVLDEVIAGQR